MTEKVKIKEFQVSISLPKKDTKLLELLRTSFEEMGLEVSVEPSGSRKSRTVISVAADKIPSIAEIFDGVANKHGIRLSGYLIEQTMKRTSQRRQGNLITGSIEFFHIINGEMSACRPLIPYRAGAFFKQTGLPGSAVRT